MSGAAVGTNVFGLDTELFTRGTGGEPRGESLVQKHLDKLQQEKENLAMEKLSALMPQMGPAVRVLALKEAVFDVETALRVLRSFQSQNDEALKALHKKRKKLHDAEEEAVKEAEDKAAAISSSSESGSEQQGSSGVESSDSDDGKDRKHRRRDFKKKRKRSSKEKRSKDEKKRKKRKHKRGSDDSGSDTDDGGKRSGKKKDKAAAKSMRTNADNFGRFGIIRETDMTAKRGEFLLWAVEVKKVDPELQGRQEERELFRDFMEDYNTGTMPHRKYYNLEIYQREKLAKEAAKEGQKPKAKPAAVDDEEAVRRQREEERQKLAAERLQQAYAELQAGDKARDMREQEMLRLQMQNAYRAGDKRLAEQLFKKLMPDEERLRRGLPALK